MRTESRVRVALLATLWYDGIRTAGSMCRNPVPWIWKPATKGGRTCTRVVRHARNSFYASRGGSELGQWKKPTSGKPWAGSLADVQYSPGTRKVVTLRSLP